MKPIQSKFAKFCLNCEKHMMYPKTVFVERAVLKSSWELKCGISFQTLAYLKSGKAGRREVYRWAKQEFDLFMPPEGCPFLLEFAIHQEEQRERYDRLGQMAFYEDEP